MEAILNIPETDKQRVVIVGAGFAGLNLAKDLCRHDFQIVLIDKNNYHQFQPLFYQVATAGLEPSAIAFPLRRFFSGSKKLHFRMCELQRVDPDNHTIYTDIGHVQYDYLVIATGADTNFFGNGKMEEKTLPMKSISEALYLRNTILRNYEKALQVGKLSEQEALMNVVIVGGGPTGVELAGALAELRNSVFPKDYPELDFKCMRVVLIQGADRLLMPFSPRSSEKAKQFLEKLGVEVILNTIVKDFDGKKVTLDSGDTFCTYNLIWAAGVSGQRIIGFDDDTYTRGNRFKVDSFSCLVNHQNIFAIGDIASMETDTYPKGHPQVAQVAIQQGKNLAANLANIERGRPAKPFTYKDKGSLATIGKKLAVADLKGVKFRGFFAWVIWLIVHLFAILGTKNKLFILLDWGWSYLSSDQSLRLLIVQKKHSLKK